MENKPTVGEGCEIKQTPQGVHVDGVKQKGAIDVQIKKNSRQWTEVQITYRAHSFFKEKIGSQDVLDILQKKSPVSEKTGQLNLIDLDNNIEDLSNLLNKAAKQATDLRTTLNEINQFKFKYEIK